MCMFLFLFLRYTIFMSVKTSRNTTDIRTVDLTTLLSDTSVQELLDIVSEHPEWSIQRMVAHHPNNAKRKELLTYQDAREILRRLHLSTATQRKIRQIKTAIRRFLTILAKR